MKRRHVCNWLRPIYESGQKPKAIICETVSFAGLDRKAQLAAINAAEQWWISELRYMGFRLTNHTDGGDGHHGFRMSEETIRKVAAKNRGRKRSEETRKRNSEAQLARDPSSYPRGETHHQFGKSITPGHRDALRKGLIKYNSDPAARRYVPMSVEERKKQSERHRGANNVNTKINDQIATEIFLSEGRQIDTARRYAVSANIVNRIKRRKVWVHVTSKL